MSATDGPSTGQSLLSPPESFSSSTLAIGLNAVSLSPSGSSQTMSFMSQTNSTQAGSSASGAMSLSNSSSNNNPLGLRLDRSSLGLSQGPGPAFLQGNDIMTPRIAALMNAVNVLNKDKNDLASITSDMHSLASPFFSPTTPSLSMAPNPWSLSFSAPPPPPLPAAESNLNEVQRQVTEALSLEWDSHDQLQRPPRDMKRFDNKEWYVVCQVLQWGKNPALLMRRLSDPKKDYGLYKPPANYVDYNFQLGDLIRVTEVGYSESRNRIAVNIQIESAQFSSSPRQLNNAISNNGKKSRARNAKRKSDDEAAAAVEAAASAKSLKRKQKQESAKKKKGEAALGETANASNLALPATSLKDVSGRSITKALEMPWPNQLGSKPPRDMKRLNPKRWYVICKVAKRGSSIALFLRAVDDPEEDRGYFKPPTKFDEYPFSVGELVQLASVGYSPGRNKVALDIRIERVDASPTSAGDTVAPVSRTPELQENGAISSSAVSTSQHESSAPEMSSKKLRLMSSDTPEFSGEANTTSVITVKSS